MQLGRMAFSIVRKLILLLVWLKYFLVLITPGKRFDTARAPRRFKYDVPLALTCRGWVAEEAGRRMIKEEGEERLRRSKPHTISPPSPPPPPWPHHALLVCSRPFQPRSTLPLVPQLSARLSLALSKHLWSDLLL